MTTLAISGTKELEARFRAMGQAPKSMLRRIGIRGVENAKVFVPKRTGNLHRTIRIQAATERSVEIRAGGQGKVGYAAAVEFGSKKHVIVPVRKKALAWGGSRTLGGRLTVHGGVQSKAEFVRRRVHHPGSRAKPYLRPGLQKALDQLGLGDIVKAWNGAA